MCVRYESSATVIAETFRYHISHGSKFGKV